jgi:tripartite-type tricarboxylate transporter receptor subunit TctC
MKIFRRQFLAVASILVAALCIRPIAFAQTYPTRPITIVVPFAAGGPTDIIARVIGERMKVTLGQPLVIENTTGAMGTIGLGKVVRAAPDGYTVSIGLWSTHVLSGAFYPLQFDLLKDFEPVALLPSNPYVIVSKNSVPANNLKELIAWLKANPDKASAGTNGAGSGQHVSAVYFQSITGTRFGFVPYRGSAPAIQDLMAGQIDLTIDQLSSVLPYVRSGKIRAYAVTSKSRMSEAPDIPTVDEAGVAGLYVTTWYGLWVPKATPKDIIAKLNAAVVDALADPTVRKGMAELALTISPREQQTPEALGVLQRAEIDKWWPIVRPANIKGE